MNRPALRRHQGAGHGRTVCRFGRPETSLGCEAEVCPP